MTSQSAGLPLDVLYAIIGLLGTSVLVLCGLWVRAKDGHQQWSTERINAHERTIAILEHDYKGIREDLGEIKSVLREHTNHYRRWHDAISAKLGIEAFEE